MRVSEKFFKANCPHGCPCEHYNCENPDSDDPDLIIDEAFDIQRNQKIGEILSYEVNYSFEFELKVKRSHSNCAQILQGNFKQLELLLED